MGLCGGYTTFSSSSLQALDLLRTGATGRAGVNVVSSVVLCADAVTVGDLVAARVDGDAVAVAQAVMREEV